MLHLILFLAFGAVCVAGAVNLLVQRHPINSALSLVVVMGSLAAEYLLLGAEFVAAVQVIVYAGAVMVLFVFVITVERRRRGTYGWQSCGAADWHSRNAPRRHRNGVGSAAQNWRTGCGIRCAAGSAKSDRLAVVP